ncbi:hypothetical protein ACHAW5_008273 [Stephanodiscus triporus]|uniref:Uncharacterized protein n=1 Tax=Stephanodiscus triporus TaxID=2934178 RepID=A0ABD3MNL3_9STRA
MRVSSSFIFLLAAISCDPSLSLRNIFDANAVGGEIDYLEATSDFVEADVDFVGGGIDDVEATSYHPVEAGAEEGAYGVSDASVKAVAEKNMFSGSLEASTAAVVMGPNMLDKQIMCGYQGWFGFPGDGAPINRWRHWFRGNLSAPTYDNVTVDMYPTTDEYSVDDMKQSGVIMPDGNYSNFFSSARPNVVLKHFQWMVTYGITGVFHHRFMSGMQDIAMRDTRTMILRNVRSAAEETGQVFAVSYDIAGTGNDVIESLKADWMMLVDMENITSSSNYIRQKGLPVLHIYGIGFTSIPVNDTIGMQNLINWLKSENATKYRAFVLGGVPGKWRTQTGDSRTGDGWKNIYDSLDGIHAWHVGRWNSQAGFTTYYSDNIRGDAAYCKTRGVLYMPTMWPGFSWHNLKSTSSPQPVINSIPRDGGNFMWKMAHEYVANSNITAIWCAQFDEVDEGTAIFKVTARTNDLPLPKGGWLALDADGTSLPSDWYLRLTGEAQRMLEGKRALTSSIPLDPNAPWVPYTSSPTRNPTSSKPTFSPTAEPTSSKPTSKPTLNPTAGPTSSKPTFSPTGNPTSSTPTSKPTLNPTAEQASSKPTSKPTLNPTAEPTSSKPTFSPTGNPTSSKPTSKPTLNPTAKPTSSKPTTRMPTSKPTTRSPTTRKPANK